MSQPAETEVLDPDPDAIVGLIAAVQDGSWAALHGRLFSLNFFFFPGRHGSRALSEIGFEAVRDRLKAAYGKPADEGVGRNGNHSAFCEVGESSIDETGW